MNNKTWFSTFKHSAGTHQWEPAEFACDYEHGDLVYSEGPHGKLHKPKLMHKKVERGYGKGVNGLGLLDVYLLAFLMWMSTLL